MFIFRFFESIIIFLLKKIWIKDKEVLNLKDNKKFHNDMSKKFFNIEIINELSTIYDDSNLNNILEEAYMCFESLFNDKNFKKLVNELTKEESSNIIDWLDNFYIEEFKKREEYEKCNLLNKISSFIKKNNN